MQATDVINSALVHYYRLQFFLKKTAKNCFASNSTGALCSGSSTIHSRILVYPSSIALIIVNLSSLPGLPIFSFAAQHNSPYSLVVYSVVLLPCSLLAASLYPLLLFSILSYSVFESSMHVLKLFVHQLFVIFLMFSNSFMNGQLGECKTQVDLICKHFGKHGCENRICQMVLTIIKLTYGST